MQNYQTTQAGLEQNVRSGKEQPEDTESDGEHRSSTFHAQQPSQLHISKINAREPQTRMGAASIGTNHIVVGQFGDPKPMIMGVTSTRKNSPRSNKKSLEFKNGRR